MIPLYIFLVVVHFQLMKNMLCWLGIDIWRKVVYQNNPFLLFEFRSEYHLSMNLELRRLVLMVVGFSRISWKTLHEQLLTCSMGCLRL